MICLSRVVFAGFTRMVGVVVRRRFNRDRDPRFAGFDELSPDEQFARLNRWVPEEWDGDADAWFEARMEWFKKPGWTWYGPEITEWPKGSGDGWDESMI